MLTFGRNAALALNAFRAHFSWAASVLERSRNRYP